MSKIKIHEFNPVIYPFKLWVMVTDNVDDIENNFRDEEDRLIDSKHFSKQAAITMLAIKKDTLDCGVLIVFREKWKMCIRNIAHESYHFADFYADEMGMDCERNQSNEHIAYLVGWAAQCCEEVKNYKHNKTKD